MTEFNRLEVSRLSGSAGYITVAQFNDRKIMETAQIHEIGAELDALATAKEHENLLLNFSNVEFVSSAALNKLINMNKKVKAKGGKLKLTNLRPEIQEVFVITRLNKLFDIVDTQAAALGSY